MSYIFEDDKSVNKGMAALTIAATILTPNVSQAQARQRAPQPQGYAVQRPAPMDPSGRAMPRAQANVPAPIRDGTRVGNRNFSTNFYFYSGPFGSFDGYVRYGNFFPFGFGPVPMSYFWAMSLPNESRFGPTIGEQRMMRRGIGAYPTDIYPGQVRTNAFGKQYVVGKDQTITYGDPELLRQLREENARLSRENLGLLEKEAERRGYERGLAESRIPEGTQTEEKTTCPLGYSGRIDRSQYVPEFNSVTNCIFGPVARDTGKELHSYADIENGKLVSEILGTPDSQLYLTVDFSDFSGKTGPEFREYTLDKLKEIRLDIRRDYNISIPLINHSAR